MAVMFISSQLSLFFDILLCLTTEIERDDYVTGAFKSTPGRASPVPGVSDSPQPTLLRARALLWKALRGLKMRAGGWAVHANNHRLSTPFLFPLSLCLPSLSPHTLIPSHPHTHITVRLKGVEHDYLRHKAADVLTRYLGNKQVRSQLPLHTCAQMGWCVGACVCVCV